MLVSQTQGFRTRLGHSPIGERLPEPLWQGHWPPSARPASGPEGLGYRLYIGVGLRPCLTVGSHRQVFHPYCGAVSRSGAVLGELERPGASSFLEAVIGLERRLVPAPRLEKCGIIGRWKAGTSVSPSAGLTDLAATALLGLGRSRSNAPDAWPLSSNQESAFRNQHFASWNGKRGRLPSGLSRARNRNCSAFYVIFFSRENPVDQIQQMARGSHQQGPLPVCRWPQKGKVYGSRH